MYFNHHYYYLSKLAWVANYVLRMVFLILIKSYASAHFHPRKFKCKLIAPVH